jgi:hypothetical protein
VTRERLGALTALEGRQVSVALRNGERIDDSQLISAGRNRAGTLWLFTHGGDTFVALEDVIDVWEAPSPSSRKFSSGSLTKSLTSEPGSARMSQSQGH